MHRHISDIDRKLAPRPISVLGSIEVSLMSHCVNHLLNDSCSYVNRVKTD